MPFRGIRLVFAEGGGFAWFSMGKELGGGTLNSLQAKDIGHGVEKGDWSGCFCHDAFELGKSNGVQK